MEDTTYDDDDATVSTTTTAKTMVAKFTPTLSIRTAEMMKLPRRIHSTTSLNLEQARLASGLKRNQFTQITDDYRAREQAEFDAIIKGSQLGGFDTLHTTSAPTTNAQRQETISQNLANYTPRVIKCRHFMN